MPGAALSSPRIGANRKLVAEGGERHESSPTVRVRRADDRPKVDQVAEPKITAPDDVIVRIGAAGLCRTDLHIIEGVWKDIQDPHRTLLPYILGHENAGWVEEVGSGVRSVKKGDAVICHPLRTCGVCLAAGAVTTCTARTPFPRHQHRRRLRRVPADQRARADQAEPARRAGGRRAAGRRRPHRLPRRQERREAAHARPVLRRPGRRRPGSRRAAVAARALRRAHDRGGSLGGGAAAGARARRAPCARRRRTPWSRRSRS